MKRGSTPVGSGSSMRHALGCGRARAVCSMAARILATARSIPPRPSSGRGSRSILNPVARRALVSARIGPTPTVAVPSLALQAHSPSTALQPHRGCVAVAHVWARGERTPGQARQRIAAAERPAVLPDTATALAGAKQYTPSHPACAFAAVFVDARELCYGCVRGSRPPPTRRTPERSVPRSRDAAATRAGVSPTRRRRARRPQRWTRSRAQACPTPCLSNNRQNKGPALCRLTDAQHMHSRQRPRTFVPAGIAWAIAAVALVMASELAF